MPKKYFFLMMMFGILISANVYAQNKVEFSVVKTDVTIGEKVKFLNNSAGYFEKFKWYFNQSLTSEVVLDLDKQKPPYPDQEMRYPEEDASTVNTIILEGYEVGYQEIENYIPLKFIKTHYIKVSPLARFCANPATGAAPLTAYFCNISIGDFDSVEWNFGDGETSSEFFTCEDALDCTNSVNYQHGHIYKNPGVYSVSLTIKKSVKPEDSQETFLLENSYVADICIDPELDFDASPKSGKSPLEVSFWYGVTGKIDSLIWNFGDDSQEVTLTPGDTGIKHTYEEDGVYSVSLRAFSCGTTRETTLRKTDLIEVKNRPPVAEAGSNKEIFGLNQVTLDGSQSADPDEDLIACMWSLISAPPEATVNITNANACIASFIPAIEGIYSFRLQVSEVDDNALTDEDYVLVAINSPRSDITLAPVSASPKSASLNETVTLDGSANSGLQNHYAFLWQQIMGPKVSITNYDQPIAQVIPQKVGKYAFTLILYNANIQTDAEVATFDVPLTQPAQTSLEKQQQTITRKNAFSGGCNLSDNASDVTIHSGGSIFFLILALSLLVWKQRKNASETV